MDINNNIEIMGFGQKNVYFYDIYGIYGHFYKNLKIVHFCIWEHKKSHKRHILAEFVMPIGSQ